MQDNLKIFLIEDDYALAMGTEYALQDEGMQVWHAKDFTAVQQIFQEQTGEFDLILLDVMLPDANGYEVFEWIHGKNKTIPIIFLTALDDEGNVVHGLSIGAADYVTKPFRMKELIARIRANIHKNKTAERQIPLQSAGIQLDEEQYCIQKNGERIELTPSEFRLLRHLMRHPGQTLTREQLMDSLWSVNEAFVDDNTLSVYIRRIREKIDDKGGDSHIKTIRGVGYAWM